MGLKVRPANIEGYQVVDDRIDAVIGWVNDFGDGWYAHVLSPTKERRLVVCLDRGKEVAVGPNTSLGTAYFKYRKDAVAAVSRHRIP